MTQSRVQSKKRTVSVLDLITSWNLRGYPLERHGDEVSVVMVGNDFTSADAWSQWLELIRISRPEYALTSLVSTHIYEPHMRTARIQPDRELSQLDLDLFEDFGFPQSLLSTADQLGVTVIGCGISVVEEERAAVTIARGSQHYEYLPYYGLATQNGELVDTRKLSESYALIERRTAHLIARYEAVSSRPVVVGMWPRCAQRLHECGELQKLGFGYAYIDQALY